jgi:DNA polymerase I
VNKRPPKNGETVKKIQNTLLVDGNALFKRAFAGAKDEYNHKGEFVGGLYSFLTTVRKLLTEDLYHRVYIFWDGKLSGRLRYDIYEPYKSARGKDYKNGTYPIDDEEIRQRGLIWEYLNDLYVRQLIDEVVEGDDFIGYYCLIKKPNEKITICTNDRDMAQLIDDDVRIYYLDKKEYVDKSNFNSYFRYKLENACLYKMLIGDNSDSIKGIKGLGEDTLFNNFPELTERTVSLEEFIELAKEKQAVRIAEKKKPLKVLDNIINRITDGVQGEKIYEINEMLINLRKPMITEMAINNLHELIDGTLNDTGREMKKIYEYMKRDGLNKTIGETRYPTYLVPFKELINRENLIF